LAFYLGGVVPLYAFDRASVYKTTSKSVVLIFCLNKEGKPIGKGTGSIIRRDGVILTNNHVISDKKNVCPLLAVFLKPDKISGSEHSSLGKPHVARVIKLSEKFDLALLKIAWPSDTLPVMLLHGLDSLDVGSEVIAIGHPGGGSVWTLTGGSISAAVDNYGNKKGYNVYQTDAPLNPGNSGGPLIDKNGKLVGVNTFVSRGGRIVLDGLGFASQTSTIRSWIGQDFFKEALPEAPKSTALPSEQKKLSPQKEASAPEDAEKEQLIDPSKLASFLDKVFEPEAKRKQAKRKKEIQKNDDGLNKFLNSLELE
jgi:S1-C subfamily serine protease